MSRLRADIAGAWAGWERFWFAEQETSTLALLRIVFGVVILAWTLSFSSDIGDFFGRHAIVSSKADAGPWTWTLLDLSPSTGLAWAVWAMLIVASIALIVGWHSRLASLLVFVGVVSFEYRNTFIGNSGDALLRIIALCVMLAPSGAALSLDRLRRVGHERFWEHPRATLWSLRLLQVQLSVLYISSVWAKVRGTSWNNGTAVSIAERIDDVHRFPVPSFVTHSLLVSNVLTFGGLAVELGVGVLVWNRRARPWILALGLFFHATLGYGLRLGFFVPALATLYVAFLDPAAATRLIERVRAWRAGPRVTDAA